MDDTKWLKRKYPNASEDVLRFAGGELLGEIRKRNMRLGRLAKDSWPYKVGEICAWKRYKSRDDDGIWDGTFDFYCVVKCRKETQTQSGYHSIGNSLHRGSIAEIERGER